MSYNNVYAIFFLNYSRGESRIYCTATRLVRVSNAEKKQAKCSCGFSGFALADLAAADVGI